MRPNASTFSGAILAFFAIDAGAGTDVISNHQAYNQIVVALSTTALAGLVFNQVWPRPLDVLVGRFRSPPTLSEPDPFMPLRDAARELHEANLKETLGVWARELTDGSEDGIFNWLGDWIARRFTPIYGKRPGSTVVEEIPPVRFTLGGVEGGAARIERDGQDTYLDLAVKRDAFRAMIPDLSITETPR